MTQLARRLAMFIFNSARKYLQDSQAVLTANARPNTILAYDHALRVPPARRL
jgi:hypothetical protein